MKVHKIERITKYLRTVISKYFNPIENNTTTNIENNVFFANNEDEIDNNFFMIEDENKIIEEIVRFDKGNDASIEDVQEPIEPYVPQPVFNDISSIIPVTVDDEKKINTQNETKPDLDSPLLRNKPFVKLAEECANILIELDKICSTTVDQHEKDFSSLIMNRIECALELSGVKRIDNDKFYDNLRHEITPPKLVFEEVPIKQFVSYGFCIENKIIKRAKVILDLELKHDL